MKKLFTLLCIAFSLAGQDLTPELPYHGFGSEKDLDHFETLLKEACHNVGVSSENCSAIFAKSLAKRNGSLIAMSVEKKPTNPKVFVNTDYLFLATGSYGTDRFFLHHEATHILQGPGPIIELVYRSEEHTRIYQSKNYEKQAEYYNKNPLLTSEILDLEKQHPEKELRAKNETEADTIACTRCKCCGCVEEACRLRPRENTPYGHLGSIKMHQLNTPARKQNLLCTHHKKDGLSCIPNAQSHWRYPDLYTSAVLSYMPFHSTALLDALDPVQKSMPPQAQENADLVAGNTGHL